MKNFFTLLLVFCLHSAWANNYYFSAVSGDDSRTAAQAQNPSTPWKTISKLNAYFTSFQPGDSVLLKRGETFYGSITVSKSGTVSLPIVISAYGSGAKPVITSLVTLDNWVSVGNGIWESYNSSLGTKVSTVLLNGMPQELGRYPNSDAVNKGYLTINSHISNSITDSELTSSLNWTGAELVLRSRRWVTDRCLITSDSGITITYAAATGYGAIDGYGYFIQNDIKTLDKFGEWYYNPSAKKLSVYFGSNTPSSYAVQATAIDNLVNSEKYNNLVFDNLNIKGANVAGISVRYGSNMRVTNCDIIFSGENGVAAFYDNNFRIENCSVSYSNANGINFGYSGDNAVIRNNKVTNTSVFAGMGGSGDGKGIGIQNYGNKTIIEYNEITNTGYSGITFNGDSTIVKNNFIDTYCTTKDDGAGIYTYTGASNVNKYGRKVIGNIIVNGIGAPEGIDNSNAAAEGIYLDDNSSGIEISNNTVANISGRGMFLNNARDLVIRNNTFYNNWMQFYAHQYRKIAGAAIRNLNVKQNIFFAKGNNQKAAYFTTEQDDNNLIGTLDSNFYARPIDDRLVIFNSYVNSSGVRINENLDLEGWKNRYNKDSASKRTAKPISPYRLNSLTGTNKFVNGTFSVSMRGVIPSSCTASLSNTGQLDGSCLAVGPTSQYSSVFVNIGDLKAGSKYILKFSAISSDTNSRYIGVSLRKAVSPYTGLTPIQYRKVNLSRTDNEMLFSSFTNETTAQIEFRSDNQNKYYLDNIQLYEVDANITNIDDTIRFEYNQTRVSKTVSLNGSYVDTKNNKYVNSIELQPYQSAVLIKNAVANTAPTVSITSPAANASFAAPASITITATAADTDGTISKVDFYNKDTLIGTAASSPYTFTWNNVPAGNYSITAKATDNGSLVTASSAVAISVYTPNIAPSVSITSPAVSFAAPASITINAAAADSDVKISKVDFYNSNTLIGTVTASPYTFTWNNVPAGTYSITAKATDDSSAVTTSAAVAILVYTPNVAPSVNLTSPVANSAFAAPSSVTISATAADSDGSISKVSFYNNDTLIGTAAASPYTFTWNNVPTGSYSITAKATDDSSAVTTSAAVAISVYTPNVAPSVSLTSPVATAKYIGPATINMSAAASDADGTVSSVKFYNGTTYLKTVFASPYTYSMTNVAAGSYTITAKATDNKGGITISAPVTVTVLQNAAPSVSITSPVINATYNAPATINLSALASDKDGSISKVSFYNGTTLLTSKTSAPYTYSWQNVPAGVYTIIAKATDNKGAVTTSQSVIVSVVAVAPTATLKPAVNNDTARLINTVHAMNLQSNNVIKEKPATYNVRLFPNPAISKIQINVEGLTLTNQKANLSITNLSGIMIKSIPVILSGKTIEADVSSLTAGMYILNIISDNLITSKKFIKN